MENDSKSSLNYFSKDESTCSDYVSRYQDWPLLAHYLQISLKYILILNDHMLDISV